MERGHALNLQLARVAQRCQEHVRLAAMVGLVVEEMVERRRQPLRDRAHVGHRRIGEPPGKIPRRKRADPFDGALVFDASRRSLAKSQWMVASALSARRPRW